MSDELKNRKMENWQRAYETEHEQRIEDREEIERLKRELASLRARPQEPRQTIAKKFHAVIALAEECFAEFECKNPQNGAPGYPHCAACCGGTGIEAVCQEEFDFATALHDLAAAGWRYFNATGPDGQTPLNENLSAPSGPLSDPKVNETKEQRRDRLAVERGAIERHDDDEPELIDDDHYTYPDYHDKDRSSRGPELCKERGHHTYPDEPPWGHSLDTPLRCQVCGESTGPC